MVALKLLPDDGMKLPSTSSACEEHRAIGQIDFGSSRAPGHGKAIVSGGYFITDDHNGDQFVVTLPPRLERGC
jgi:hypothetical protein